MGEYFYRGELLRETISTITEYGSLLIEERRFIDDNVHDFVITWKNGDAEGNAHGNHNTHSADLRRVDVEPQGMGQGTIFYKQIEDWLRDRGVTLITLWCVRSARSFWFRMGFRPEEGEMEDFTHGTMYKKI